MDVETLVELLEAAGYGTHHAHLKNIPLGKPEVCLAVYAGTDQDPPITGLLKHLDTEPAFDGFDRKDLARTVRAMMADYRMLPVESGGVLCLFLDIAMECNDVETEDPAHVQVTSPGSNASN